MANLTFAESHNMVAYLEKSAENVDFAEIVNFLNANPIKKTKRKATEISQSSGPATLVADETVYEERGDRVERVVTTAASLDVEQDSGGSLRCQDTILRDSPAQARVLALENNKTAQDLEITHLKKRVKRLEKKRKLRTPQLKRRLFKVRRESSAKKVWVIRRIHPTRRGMTKMKGFHLFRMNAPITTVGVSVSTAEPSTPPTTTTTVIKDKDLTISKTLMKLRSEKSKEKAKERGSKENYSETASRPTRRVIMREASETTTKPTVPPQQKLDLKDKAVRLQAELDEEERQTIVRVHESASSSNSEEWEDIQARVEDDKELVQRLQVEEREMYTKAEQARMLAEFINQRKKRVNIFVLTKSKVDRAVPELAVGSLKRDVEEELDQGGSKRQHTSKSLDLAKELRDKEADELSQEELQQIMIIVPKQGMNVEALQTKYPIIDYEIYTEGTKKYWKIIRVGNHTEVELKRFFEPDTDDELWKLQNHIHDLTWRLNDSYRVHHVSTEKGINVYMLVKKEYPLSSGTLTLMLVAKLLVDEDNEMSMELLRKIFMQAERPRR
nr:hypothetical protein [Tanacetum cinerariifolium]